MAGRRPRGAHRGSEEEARASRGPSTSGQEPATPIVTREVDCAVDLDTHEHRVLHYLSRRMKGKRQAVTYDFAESVRRRNDVTQEDLRWALERLADEWRLVERVADETVLVLFPCTCVSKPGMYDRNRQPPELEVPECEVGPDCDEYGNVYVVEFGKKTSTTRLDKHALAHARLRDRPEDAPEERGRAPGEELTTALVRGSSTGSNPSGLMEESASGEVGASDMALTPSDMALRPGSGKLRPKSGPGSAVEELNASDLAKYFAEQCAIRAWGKSPEPVNIKALANRIAAWRRNGTSNDLIVRAMDRYIGRVRAGPKRGAPLWKEFCSQITVLIRQAASGSGGDAGERIRWDEEAWLRSDPSQASENERNRYDPAQWVPRSSSAQPNQKEHPNERQ